MILCATADAPVPDSAGRLKSIWLDNREVEPAQHAERLVSLMVSSKFGQLPAVGNRSQDHIILTSMERLEFGWQVSSRDQRRKKQKQKMNSHNRVTSNQVLVCMFTTLSFRDMFAYGFAPTLCVRMFVCLSVDRAAYSACAHKSTARNTSNAIDLCLSS